MCTYKIVGLSMVSVCLIASVTSRADPVKTLTETGKDLGGSLKASAGQAHKRSPPDKPDYQLEVDSLFAPFYGWDDLHRHPREEYFKSVGFVGRMNTRLASASLFSACFTISSRTKVHRGVCFRLAPMNALLTLRGHTDTFQGKFQFDLRQLHPNVTDFNPRRRTIVIIPGYLTGTQVDWQREIADEWLKLEDVNVIQVHWPEGNNRLVYEAAAANVQILARQIVILLFYLVNMNDHYQATGWLGDGIHLVGHSLGAHAAGFVGKELYSLVDRITALDPAGPVFDLLPEHQRLSRSDAKFVDVLHTNAGKIKYMHMGVAIAKKALASLKSSIWSNRSPDTPSKTVANIYETLKLSQTRRKSDTKFTAWFGFERPLGHMDYYANGGSIQPGCQDELHICDHGRATQLYLEFLRRELADRNNYGAQSRLVREKRHRLFAFRSREYQALLSGDQIHPECSDFILSSSYGDANQRATTQKLCTVPIDFTSTGRELHQELSEVYTINLEDGDSRRRYYFETLNRRPYVAEQMLMEIHTKHDKFGPRNWSDGCRLIALVRPTCRELAFTQFDHQPNLGGPTMQKGSHSFIIPIAKTTDPMNTLVSPELLKSFFTKTDSRELLASQLQAHLASYLVMKVVHEDTRSLVQSFGSFWKQPHRECWVEVDKVQIRSLGVGDASANLTLWYTATDSSPDYDDELVRLDSVENIQQDKRRIGYANHLSPTASEKHFSLSAIGIGVQPEL